MHNLKRFFSSIIIVIVLLFLPREATHAAEYFVSPSGNDSAAGSQSAPWRTIGRGSQAAQPGDTITIRAGTYAEQLTPARNGTAGSPITYRAAAGEQVLLDGNNQVYRNIEIIGRSYIVIDGLRVEEPQDSWAHIQNSSYITLQNMSFDNPTYPAGMVRNFAGVLIRTSNHIRVLRSTFDRWGRYENGDSEGNNLRIIGWTTAHGYNLIEDNTFLRGAQGDVQVLGPWNVIRRNTFNNEWQKGVHVGWFGAPGNRPGDEPETDVYRGQHNLIEENQFIRHGHSQYSHGGLAIEEDGEHTIIRRNVIRNTEYLGLMVSVFGDYTPLGFNGRIYNNTLVNNGLNNPSNSLAYFGTGMELSDHGLTNVTHRNYAVKNNIVYDNKTNANGESKQLTLQVTGSQNNPPFGGYVIAGNLIHNRNPGTCSNNGACPLEVVTRGTGNVAWFNNLNPNFYGNVEITTQSPGFVAYNPSQNQFDLRLNSNSPAVDAGVSLTTTTAAGSGTAVTVADALYFQDGYSGMIAGDTIRIGNETVTITAVDYATNRITINRSISWVANAPVNLSFSGNAPDIGAYEYGTTQTVSPTSGANQPTPTPGGGGGGGNIPGAPAWFALLPTNLRDFLEVLYLWTFVYRRPTNMMHLLEGIVEGTVENTPTPTAGSQPTPTRTPTPVATAPTSTRTPTPQTTLPPIGGSGNTYYVSPSGNDSNAGTQASPWRTISFANSRLNAGDTVMVRAGTYGPGNDSFVIRPARSGTAGNPITYRAFPGETVNLERATAIVNLHDRNYIVVDGFTIRDTLTWGSWARLWHANYNELRNNTFTFSSELTQEPIGAGWIGIDIANGSYNKILNSRIERWGEQNTTRRHRLGGDAIQINNASDYGNEGVPAGASHHNLVQGNTFFRAQHSNLQIDGGYENVIKDNIFENDIEKTLELTDRGYVSANEYRWNLVEGNTFLRNGFDDNAHGGDHIHGNSSYTIYRRNTFRDSGNASVNFATWGEETVRTIGNRFFHNTMVNNGNGQARLMECFSTGLLIPNSGYTGSPNNGHIIKNNIFYDNAPLDCGGQFNPPRHVQLAISIEGQSPTPNFYGIRVAGNILYGQSPNDEVISVRGLQEGTVAYYQQNYPNIFSGNIQEAPQFVTYNIGTRTNQTDGQYDLHLQANSPGIDDGVALTTTTSAGSGTVIPVSDALFFHDGFNNLIAPDTIRVGSETATVTDIDYTNNRITVNRSISWSANAPVNLPFNGNAPDIGAYEHGSVQGVSNEVGYSNRPPRIYYILELIRLMLPFSFILP